MNAPKTYRKKPVEIQAMQLIDDVQAHMVMEWMEDNLYPFLIGNALYPEALRYPDQVEGDNTRPDKGHYIDPATGHLMIRTMEGDMRSEPGDWIIQGVQGEFYPCKPDIFAETYQAVNTDGII